MKSGPLDIDVALYYGWAVRGRSYSRGGGCLVVTVAQFREHERRAEGAKLFYRKSNTMLSRMSVGY